jgi:hypothetical protein
MFLSRNKRVRGGSRGRRIIFDSIFSIIFDSNSQRTGGNREVRVRIRIGVRIRV